MRYDFRNAVWEKEFWLGLEGCIVGVSDGEIGYIIPKFDPFHLNLLWQQRSESNLISNSFSQREEQTPTSQTNSSIPFPPISFGGNKGRETRRTHRISPFPTLSLTWLAGPSGELRSHSHAASS